MRKGKKHHSKFGGYIGKAYTVKDAVLKTVAVVPLLYEGRHNQSSQQELHKHVFRKLAVRNNLTEKRGRTK
jgi:type I restriction enzyme R subunit